MDMLKQKGGKKRKMMSRESDLSDSSKPKGDSYYMGIAKRTSRSSKDPNFQVGACIVDTTTGKIVGTGYNCEPKGLTTKMPWNDKNEKKKYVCHAEMNAILNMGCCDVKKASSLTLYVTLNPCNHCAKVIVQADVKKVVYKSNEEKSIKDDYKNAIELFNACGVECRQYVE